jgi:uncharacterized protein
MAPCLGIPYYSDMSLAHLSSLYRYPVKGLSPEPLKSVVVEPGQTFPADRRYAIENGPSGFDAAAPAWLSKSFYLMLMRNEQLAELRTQYDDQSHILTVNWRGDCAARGDLRTPEGRGAVEAFFATHFAGQLRGRPAIVSGGDHSFSDVAQKVVSIINLESVLAIENMVGLPVHPLRFRANAYVSGWPAWGELELLGQTLAVGNVRLKVVKRITRCAAINVDPESGARDLDIAPQMSRRLGHLDCGVYAKVIAGGTIKIGDAIETERPLLI